MASSSSLPAHRRKPLKKRQPLARSNSSLLGTIKNIVTAPLAWFASTDDFEDTKDLGGKRRRLVAVPTEPNIGEDDGPKRIKRMRVHSPPKSHQKPTPFDDGYLDPPGTAFRSRNQSNSSILLPVSRSSPVYTPQSHNLPRNNNGVFRASTLTRTMSIDPPSRPIHRSSAVVPLNSDTSMDLSTSFVRRDLSMPPLSTRPSFRMRTSMTPQPQVYREKSEPPDLTTLVANPMFVRGPAVQSADSHQQVLPRQSSVTLGSLVESVRSTRSPVRQHSSLLFGPTVEHNTETSNKEIPAEKALHELDIYKTPLLPTRLRSSNLPASSSAPTDLFKSRRGAHLVLMQDDKRPNQLGRRNNSKKERPLINETKPYAGEGGMKKLLARRRVEAEAIEGNKRVGSNDMGIQADHIMANDHFISDEHAGIHDIVNTSTSHMLLSHTPKHTLPTMAPSPKPQSSSSLRVGRTKTRSHIARPSRPMRTKFSAAYDDDEIMDDAQWAIEKDEKEKLEEAAERAPLFNIPIGFSFSTENISIEHDSSSAKEPPIVSLPFSFARQTPVSDLLQAPVAHQSQVPPQTTPIPPPSAPQPSSSRSRVNLSTIENVPSPTPQATPQPEQTTPTLTAFTASSPGPSKIPNFFSETSIFAKPLDILQCPPLTFSMDSNRSTQDAENQERDGVKSEPEVHIKNTHLFDGPGRVYESHNSTSSTGFATQTAPILPSSTSVFGLGMKEVTSRQRPLFTQPPADLTSASLPAGAVAPTSFEKETIMPALATGSTPGHILSTSFEAPKPPAPAPGSHSDATSPATFSISKHALPAEASVDATKSLFGGVVGVDVPEPLLGGAFRYRNDSEKDREQKPIPTPFSFGAAPSTPPPVDTKKPTGFTFESLSASGPVPPSAPSSTVFSFNPESNTAITPKPFSFGTSTPAAVIDRPMTPPKGQDQEFSMEESPTRDMQQVNGDMKPTDRPVGSGFSFGSGTSGFGDPPNRSTAPFSFGVTSTDSRLFAKETNSDKNKPFGGFGQTTTSTGFSFGQSKISDSKDPTRPPTSGSFSFGSAPPSATNTGPSFAFGGPPIDNTSNPFGQASGSAPSSPSTFSQPSPFSFTAPLPLTTSTFSFGSSQPASPAGGNTGLPQTASSGGFGSSSGGLFGQSHSTPFSVPATTSTSGTLFTIGAAPSAPMGNRQIRKLPNRRGGAKR